MVASVINRDRESKGEYRTTRVILEIYDRMAEAIRTDVPYQTLLDPPPGPPAAVKDRRCFQSRCRL